VFGKLLTNQKIAHKIVKPYVYKALREGLKLMTTVKYKISEGSIPSLSDAAAALLGLSAGYSSTG
jgi:hypothetical protein